MPRGRTSSTGSSSSGSFHVSPDTLENVSGRLGDTSSQLHGISTQLGGVNLSQGSLGSLAQGTVASASQTFGHAGTSVAGQASHLEASSSAMHTTSQNYAQTEAQVAQSFNSIHPDYHGTTVHDPGYDADSESEPAAPPRVRPPKRPRPQSSGSSSSGSDSDGPGPGKRPRVDSPMSVDSSDSSSSAGTPGEPTPDELVGYGRTWNAHAWIGSQNPNQAGTAANANMLAARQRLQQYGLGFGRSPFQQHEPLVRAPGGLSTYNALTSHFGNQADGGAGAAQHINEWINGTRPFSQLTPHERDFATITHVAETARGYTYDVDRLGPNMQAIGQMPPAQARQNWGNINQWFPPARTFRNDEQNEWQPYPQPMDNLPSSDSESESGHTSGYEGGSER